MCRSSLRVAGRPAYHAYASSYDSTYGGYPDWARSSPSSASELRPSVGSPVWSTRPPPPPPPVLSHYSGGMVSESPLPAPPKPRRSRSPGERSTSSSESQSRDFDADVPPVQSWETLARRSDLMDSTADHHHQSPSRRVSASHGYPHVFYPGTHQWRLGREGLGHKVLLPKH